MGIATAIGIVAAGACASAGLRHSRAWGANARWLGHAALAIAAALLVLLLQSVSVGASFEGVVLALAVGGMTLLVVMLVSST